MRIALWVLGTVAALVTCILIAGWTLPVKHHVSRDAHFDVPVESVFALISSPAEFPRWRSGLSRVDVLPDSAGQPRFRETSKSGTILYAVERSVPNSQWVTRIADESLPFGGTWTYEVLPRGTGTTLRLTEDGEVYNPLFRFVSRYVMGETSTIDQYLSDAQKRFAVR